MPFILFFRSVFWEYLRGSTTCIADHRSRAWRLRSHHEEIIIIIIFENPNSGTTLARQWLQRYCRKSRQNIELGTSKSTLDSIRRAADIQPRCKSQTSTPIGPSMWSASLLQRHLNKLHTLLESHWHEGGLHLKQSFILNSPSSSERKRWMFNFVGRYCNILRIIDTARCSNTTASQ